MALLTLEDAWKGFNERTLLRGVSLSIGEGERIGLLGPNGSGKSTLMRILAGAEPLDRGARVVRRGVNLGTLEQEPTLDPELAVRDAVRAGLVGRDRVLNELEALHERLGSAREEALPALLERQARLEIELARWGGHDVEHKVESTLQSLGLDAFDVPCGRLSGGERRRVALARLLLAGPDLLLLDEPTNHLDALVTEWLENWFVEARTPLVLVTHDRYFLDRVVDRIVELDRGELVPYPGGYGDYLEARAARLESQRKTESARQNLLRRETLWMRRGPPARTTKAKARIERFHDLVGAAPTNAPPELEFEIPPGPRLGTRVLELSGIDVRLGGRAVLANLDLSIEPGLRLGVVGPNGAGKSTLMRILSGELAPDAGRREVGETVRFMGVDQERRDLDPTRTVIEEVAGRGDVVRVGDRSVRVEGFLDRFGFPPSAQRSLVGQLSGGERNRVLLAKLLCAGGNVLLLDEPTNDLDLGTLRALEEALLAFPGTVVVVSHDRWFLDRVATRILYLDGGGRGRTHHGDLSSLLELLALERQAAKTEAAARAPAPKAAPVKAPRSKGLAPWQAKELTELEGRIGELEAAVAAHDGRLADPALYREPATVAAGVREERERLAGELERALARWEELESLR